jgi:O-glycosyl hydrolase
LGPELAGYSSSPLAGASRGSRDYIDHLTSDGKNHIYGYSFHPYADGGTTAWDNPDNHLTAMRNWASDSRYNNKPLFMTEYVRLNATPNFDHAVKLAWHIHNFLVEMKVSAYFHWTLFRTSTASTGGMINFNQANGTYELRDLYYFFKAYSYFTDPGWQVVPMSCDRDQLRVTAFRSPASVSPAQLVVVLLNKSVDNVDFTLRLTNFTAASSEAYRSSASEHWASLGSVTPGAVIALPPLSITTVRFTAP